MFWIIMAPGLVSIWFWKAGTWVRCTGVMSISLFQRNRCGSGFILTEPAGFYRAAV